MPAPDARRAEELFFAALDRPPEERRAWLRAACGDDAPLHDEVASLVDAAARGSGASSDFLESPAAVVRDPASSAARALVGRTVGDFAIADVLGEGGMGVVYRAEQMHPRRVVALKLVRPGLATSAMIRRFELEAEALGRLRHPGIATIHAAGTADLGSGAQPYFAMELVEGLPLNAYLATRRLGVRQRAALLRDIASAVQHAHQNGVIHRDIKPDNIVVEDGEDGTPRPRVLDFGVARLTRRDGAAPSTVATEAGRVVGTLQYMSPEQVETGDVDTRSDVYALGLVAWEALAGRPARSVGSGNFAEFVRTIVDVDPPALRNAAPEVPLDLAIVVGKALAREPERRYATAGELAADIDRFLGHQPIAARPPTAAYTLSRFARRHRTLVVAAGVILALLVILVPWLAIALVREREAKAQEAQRALDSSSVASYFMHVLRLDPNAPGATQIDTDSVKSLLRQLEERLDDRFADRPLPKVRVLNEIGESYNVLTEYDASERVFAKALAICDASLPKDHELRGAALHGLGAAEWFKGLRDKAYLAKAKDHYEQALAIRVAALGREHNDTALTMRHLAATLRSLGRPDDAEALYRESLAIHERLHAAGDPLADTTMVASGYNGLASLMTSKGDHAEAERLYAKSLDLMRGVPESERRVVDEARVLRNLGASRGLLGRYEDGEAALTSAEAIFRQQLGDKHREVATTLVYRMRFETRRGDATAARACAQRVVDDFGLPTNDPLLAEATRLLSSP
ncbi:MAG: serine/threonine-protein kinase [Phycisphaerales bacterium]